MTLNLFTSQKQQGAILYSKGLLRLISIQVHLLIIEFHISSGDQGVTDRYIDEMTDTN